MVSATLIKLSSPFARSCLVALGVALVIDAVLTFLAASQYPYLLPNTNELYISTPITPIYSAIGAAAILLSVSTALASYKSSTNFVLIVSTTNLFAKLKHACITGVFLPFAILVYFSSLSARYKVDDYADDYRQMIIDYRVSTHQIKQQQQQSSATSANTSSTSDGTHEEGSKKLKLISFINLIDSIQSKLSCCGVKSPQDWSEFWGDYLPSSCCKSAQTKKSTDWSKQFKVDEGYEFHYCAETDARRVGCLAALKADENVKFGWLSNLSIFLMVITITDTVLTLLLYGLSKTENMPYNTDENELSMVGVSMKPRPSQPEITGIRHRPSVVQTLGAPSKEQIASISHAVRFNLSNTPRGSISGPSKFSAGARRSSSAY